MPFNISQEEQACQPSFEHKAFVVPRRVGTSSSGDSNATRVPRTRSADSRKSKENDSGLHRQGTRKRKAGRMDETTRTTVAVAPHTLAPRPWPRAEFPKRRKRKVARPTMPTASRSAAIEEPQPVLTPSVLTSRRRMSSDGVVTSTDEESPRRPDWLRAQASRWGKLRSRRASFAEGRVHSYEDVESMKSDITALQKEVEIAQKTITDQNQVIESLKRELAASKKLSRKQGNQIEKLKSSGKKSDDILSTTQTLLQCQICLELLLKPFALSPCGHVLCQGCLQEWFRNAPKRPEEDDDDDGEPLPTVYRIKTCPCCRTEVNRRPTPLFIIKDLVAPFITEAQVPPSVPSEALPPAEVDPWAGIFCDDGDSSEVEFDEDDRYGSEEDSDGSSISQIFSSDEEDHDEPVEDEHGEPSAINFVLPAWAPGYYRATVSRRNYPAPLVSQERFQLLQRGATHQMIDRYDMRLHRNDGIVAWTDGGVEVYLGWNIARPTGDNLDGDHFMDWVESDITENPQRWRLDDRAGHAIYRRVIEDYRGTEILGLEEESEDEFDMEDEFDIDEFYAL